MGLDSVKAALALTFVGVLVSLPSIALWLIFAYFTCK
jgi:hypothetical protein